MPTSIPFLPLVFPDRPRLEERVARARSMLSHCELCEWRCGIDRLAGEQAPCRLDGDTYCFKSYISLTEERDLVPSLRVYLGGCNFRCSFCDVAPHCFKPRLGRAFEPASLARAWAAAVQQGVKIINVLGGEPSLHPHTLLEIALASPLKLPLALNTNMYMTPEVIDLLDGVVVLYIADFKFGNNDCARELAGVPRYVETVTRNFKVASGRATVLTRHLLMPGHVDCCFCPVADWMAENLPEGRLELFTSYVPSYRTESDSVMGRLNSDREIRFARNYLRQLGLAA